MNGTFQRLSAPTDDANGVPLMRMIGPLLGLATAAWILVYGLALEAPGIVPLGVLSFVPGIGMAILLGSRQGSARWPLALMPITFGVVTVVILIGTVALEDSIAWWVSGAVLAFLPFMLARRA